MVQRYVTVVHKIMLKNPTLDFTAIIKNVSLNFSGTACKVFNNLLKYGFSTGPFCYSVHMLSLCSVLFLFCSHFCFSAVKFLFSEYLSVRIK